MTASIPSASRQARASCASQGEEKVSTVTSLASSYSASDMVSSLRDSRSEHAAVAHQRQHSPEHGGEEQGGQQGGDDPRPPPPPVRRDEVDAGDAEQDEYNKQQKGHPHFRAFGGHRSAFLSTSFLGRWSRSYPGVG